MRQYGKHSFAKGSAIEGNGCYQGHNPDNTKYIDEMRAAFMSGRFSDFIYAEMGMTAADAIEDVKKAKEIVATAYGNEAAKQFVANLRRTQANEAKRINSNGLIMNLFEKVVGAGR